MEVSEKRHHLSRWCSFFVSRKPLARPVVPQKASADDDDKKTPFAILSCDLITAKKQKEVIRWWITKIV